MQELICGKNSVLEAIKNNLKIKILYVLKPIKIDNKKIQIKVISRNEMDLLTDLNHQGYIAVLETNFQYYSLEQIIKIKPEIILLLDHIEDPHNLGAIIRSANAAGVNHIIIPKNRAADITNTVWKISSGGLINMKIAKVNSLQVAIEKLKSNDYWIYVSALDFGAKEYSKINYNFPLVIVIGNEGSGASKSVIKQSDEKIFIPIKGSVQSLNASVATGILIFEIIKNLK